LNEIHFINFSTYLNDLLGSMSMSISYSLAPWLLTYSWTYYQGLLCKFS